MCVWVENYNKIESALNNLYPTPLVSSLVGSTFVEIPDSVQLFKRVLDINGVCQHTYNKSLHLTNP